MSSIYRLYKKENYKIQKIINLEDKLYTRLKEIIEKEYDATISDMVNICIEDLVKKDNINYYPKPEGEIVIYRSLMIRKENLENLNSINKKTGISITRLINMSIKEFIREYEKK